MRDNDEVRMDEETRRAGDAYREEMFRQEMEEQNAGEDVIFTLPKRGPVSWDTLERCAREAGVPMHDWVFDALASYVRMHEREIHERQAEHFGVSEGNEPKRRRVPAWRMRLGEWAYMLGDRLTDDGSWHEGPEE